MDGYTKERYEALRVAYKNLIDLHFGHYPSEDGARERAFSKWEESHMIKAQRYRPEITPQEAPEGEGEV